MTRVHPSAIVDPTARLGEDVEIGPFCIVGPGVEIGARSRLVAHVTIERNVTMGVENVVHANAVLGGAPQIARYVDGDTHLIIGDRNTIREGVTFHRGASSGNGVTRIGSGGMYMVGAHVAHDCIVGDDVVFANCATLGGHCAIGDRVVIGGLSAVHQFTRIGAYAMVGGMCGVRGDVIPYGLVAGNYAELEGLNLVGMKRRQMPRERIQAIRRAYQRLFLDPGVFAERLEQAAREFAGDETVMQIITFIRAGEHRPLCRPERGREE